MIEEKYFIIAACTAVVFVIGAIIIAGAG